MPRWLWHLHRRRCHRSAHARCDWCAIATAISLNVCTHALGRVISLLATGINRSIIDRMQHADACSRAWWRRARVPIPAGNDCRRNEPTSRTLSSLLIVRDLQAEPWHACGPRRWAREVGLTQSKIDIVRAQARINFGRAGASTVLVGDASAPIASAPFSVFTEVSAVAAYSFATVQSTSRHCPPCFQHWPQYAIGRIQPFIGETVAIG